MGLVNQRRKKPKIRIDRWARRFLLVKNNVWGKGKYVQFIVIFIWSWKGRRNYYLVSKLDSTIKHLKTLQDIIIFLTRKINQKGISCGFSIPYPTWAKCQFGQVNFNMSNLLGYLVKYFDEFFWLGFLTRFFYWSIETTIFRQKKINL